jgi:uncharacterized membrane protein
MKKTEFLSELYNSLGNMSDADKQDVLNDYEEHFRVGMADGRTEEEIAQSLGNPRVIGNSFRIDAMLDEPKEGGGTSGASVLRAVFASISLTFLNLVFVVGPFFGLVGVLIGLWAVTFSMTVSGICVSLSFLKLDFVNIPQLIDNTFWNYMFMFFSGIGIGALGFLASLGMGILTKWFFIGVASYVRFNARVISGIK